MKSTKILITALALALVMLSGCKKDVFTGIDTSKAGVTDFTFDEDASGKTSIAFYWTDDEAIKAGATSFSVQLATKADFTDIDMYDASIGKTVSATSSKHDAVTFEGLTESTWYYARVRANYPRSIYSDWTQLTANGSVICISVGHGVVVMDFVAPQNLKVTPKKYNKFTADWGTVAPCEGYAPEYKKSTESTWTPAPEVTEPTFTVTGAEEGTEYNVRVRGFRTLDGGEREYTDYVEASGSTPVRALHHLANADEVKDFFANQMAIASNSDIYYLDADVDLGAAEIAVSSAFEGEFYGQGKSISNAKVAGGLCSSLSGLFSDVTFKNVQFGAPAFAVTTSDAEITKVQFDASCTFKFADPTDSAGYGILCGSNEGTIKDCSTAVKAENTCSSLPNECTFGGLVGESTGYIENCSATGSFSIEVTAPTSGKFHWIGGVVGRVSGKAGKTLIKNCTNSGSVSLKFATAAYFVLGGVVGGTPVNKPAGQNYGIIDGLINTGDVSDYYVKGGSGAYPNVGGCIGYAEGYIQNCENSGKISLTSDSTSSDATWTNSHIGGVSGAVTAGAKNCKNHGGISANYFIAGGTAGNRGAGNISSTCIAGVIGAAGPYNGAASNVFEDLTNDAVLNVTLKSSTETPNSYFGGVIGYATGLVKNCSNKADVSFTVPTHINRLGGVIGGCEYDLTGCTNTGAVTLTNKLSATGNTAWRQFIAGICGEYDASKSTVSGNNNSGAVTLNVTNSVATSRDSGIAGVIGNDLSTDCTIAEDNVNTGVLTANTPGSYVMAQIAAQGLK